MVLHLIDWSPRYFGAREGSSTNTSIHAFSFFLAKHREPQPSSALLPMIAIGIVECAFVLLWDNLCRNSCMLMESMRLGCGFKVVQKHGNVFQTIFFKRNWNIFLGIREGCRNKSESFLGEFSHSQVFVTLLSVCLSVCPSVRPSVYLPACILMTLIRTNFTFTEYLPSARYGQTQEVNVIRKYAPKQ